MGKGKSRRDVLIEFTMQFVGLDDWSNPVYKCVENGQLYKDLNHGVGEPALYSCQNKFDGEPEIPVKTRLKINYLNQYKSEPNVIDYAILDRMRSQCDYYLGWGKRSKAALCYYDEQKHINEMKRLYKSFPANKKPAWLTWEQILEYERLMVGK